MRELDLQIQKYSDRKELVAALADRISVALRAGIQENSRASLAVSGGSTPLQLFDHLSGLDIPWQEVTITLVDERWVDAADPDSNEYLVRSHLLRNRAAAAAFVGMKNDHPTARQGESECNHVLGALPRPFDVLLLGMGNDGHTASLFPGAENLALATDMDSGRNCLAITPLSAPHERMSLTLPGILDSRLIVLHIVGNEKKTVLDKACRPGASEEMPIRFVLRQQAVPVSVYWAP